MAKITGEPLRKLQELEARPGGLDALDMDAIELQELRVMIGEPPLSTNGRKKEKEARIQSLRLQAERMGIDFDDLFTDLTT